MKKLGSAMIAVLISFMTWATDEIAGKVVTVIDGNTLEVVGEDNETYKILLYGIDCPELEQEFGAKAKKLLEKLVLEKEVQITIHGKDRWGNRLGIILVNGKSDPRFELLKEGLAWTSERNPIDELEVLKEKARVSSIGLWEEETPTPPWIFRRQQTMMQYKSS